MASLSMDDPLFATYVFYAGLLGFKMLFMSIWTARHRIAKKIFPSVEDYKVEKGKTLVFTDDDIDRIRRAHLNDMENILPFLSIALLFVFTDPKIFIAKWIFRIFTAGRFLHTLAYLNAIHGLRGVGFLSSMLVNMAMTIMVISKACGNY